MQTMTTSHSLELFMSALRGQNYSPKTLRAYGDDLKQFLGWARENRVDWDTPKRFSRVDIGGFVSYMAGQQMTGITRVRKLAACPEEVFHLLGRESHHLRQSREHCQRRETGGERAGDSLEEQYKALLYEASHHPRDYAIIMTLLQTGIRLSELANLTIDDVDLEQKLLTVRQGKGKKDRQIPLVDEVVKALRNYLRYRNTQRVLDDEVLFLAKNGTSLNVSSIKYIVAKYVKKAGIRKKVSVHTLRHTFGAHKADKNIGIATLQELMGHKKKETTLKYIHLAKTNLRQEMIETAL
jgi:site-specific recombinase XerD